MNRALTFCGRCSTLTFEATYLGHSHCRTCLKWTPRFARPPEGRVLCAVCRGSGCGRCQQTGLEQPNTPLEPQGVGTAQESQISVSEKGPRP